MKKRIPTQKRSIEKRNKIIDKGFELICKKGFYNTTTNEIADYSGVSVGIIYQYFDDKKDILICGIENYLEKLITPTIKKIETTKLTDKNIEKALNDIIETYIKSHTISKKSHEELEAMSHLDKDVAKIFKDREIKTTKTIVDILNKNNINLKNEEEKVHIIIGIVENFCHEMVYHKHKEMHYEVMKKEVIKVIINILK